MEIITWFINDAGWKLIWAPAAHFVLSGCVGLLVYWLTSTILSHYLPGGSSIPIFAKVEFGIHRFSLFLALSFAIWLHILEDYTLNWF
jgi:hypothetical protein